MRANNLDLLACVAIAGANTLWVLLAYQNPVIGTLIALPLVFFLPGYTLTEFLFYKQMPGVAERLLFGLGLSLAIDILVGFFLHFTLGIRATGWALCLSVLVAVFSLGAAIQRVWRFYRGRVNFQVQVPRVQWNVYHLMLYGMSIIVIALAVTYATIGFVQQPRPGFTQFWTLPPAQGGENCVVQLGIKSFESASVNYRVVLLMNGQQIQTWQSITLAPQQEWKQPVPLEPPTVGDITLQARLYRQEKPEEIYRQTYLQLQVIRSNAGIACSTV